MTGVPDLRERLSLSTHRVIEKAFLLTRCSHVATLGVGEAGRGEEDQTSSGARVL